MLNKTSLDERQLWLRGNVFKHGFVFLLAALAAQGICKALGVTWAQGPGEQILILWGAVALCWWEFILRGIDPHGPQPEDLLLRYGAVRGLYRRDGAGLPGGGAGRLGGGGPAHHDRHPGALRVPDGQRFRGVPGKARLGQGPPRGR